MVQHTQHEFVLSFFVLPPPIAIGATEEDRLARLAEIESVRATCVTRIAITPARMREFVDVMARNLQRYNETYPSDMLAEVDAHESEASDAE